jgi:hypothetical protein
MRRKVVSVVLLALSGLVDAAKKKASKTSTSSSEWIERSVPLSAGVCNMRSLDANQPLDELVSDLLGLTEPVLLRVGSIEPWSRTHLFERLGGSLEVDVSVGEGVIGPSDVDVSGDSPRHKMTLLDFADGLRNRTLPRDAYIFNTLALDGMADVESGTSIETSTVIQPLFRAVMASTLPRLMQLESSGTWPNATKGSLRLALGGSLSGNGWHAHGLAMNCVLSGRLATQVPSRNSTVQPTERSGAQHWYYCSMYTSQVSRLGFCARGCGDLVWVCRRLQAQVGLPRRACTAARAWWEAQPGRGFYKGQPIERLVRWRRVRPRRPVAGSL